MKYAPWNWQQNTDQATINELLAALLRHTTAASDPSQSDYDDESGLHHLTHAGACIMILLFKLDIDYAPSKFLSEPQFKVEPQGMYTNCCTPATPQFKVEQKPFPPLPKWAKNSTPTPDAAENNGTFSLQHPTDEELHECGLGKLADIRSGFAQHEARMKANATNKDGPVNPDYEQEAQ